MSRKTTHVDFIPEISTKRLALSTLQQDMPIWTLKRKLRALVLALHPLSNYIILGSQIVK
jgi:hypothetical protein